MRFAAVALLAVVAAGCGGSGESAPKEDPGVAAVRVVHQITANAYAQAWGDLHSKDQDVAPLGEYVDCETRSPVIVRPRGVKVMKVTEESFGIGDGTFVETKAVAVRLSFGGAFKVTQTVHLVAEDGRWKWILPSFRFRDYKANRCPVDPGSSAPPSTS
jgi:hypothetical protein